MRRALLTDDLESIKPLQPQSILGIVDGDALPKLIQITQAEECETSNGFYSPFHCTWEIINPMAYCSVRQFWPIIIQFNRSVELLPARASSIGLGSDFGKCISRRRIYRF